MKFKELVVDILGQNPKGLTPQEIREIIKKNYPNYYGSERHIISVDKGHYNDLGHALLAQIYICSKSPSFDIDRSEKPFRIRLAYFETTGVIDEEEELIEREDIERIESGDGLVYVLGTNVYTKEGREIIKIGITTSKIENRINQLYTTGVPFKFRRIKEVETKCYNELEQSMHKLLSPYRINSSREFFIEDCLPFFDQILEIHNRIQEKTTTKQ